MGLIKHSNHKDCNSKTVINTLLSFMIVLFSLFYNHNQLLAATITKEHKQQLIKSIAQIREKTHTPGLSIGLTYLAPEVGAEPPRARETWQYQSGVADIASKSPLESRHLFRTGSVSKLAVAIAIMQLVENQQLTLQSKIKELLPELFFINPWQDTQPLLVAHLLNHSSGWDAPHFAANIPQNNDLSKQHPFTIKDALNIHPHSRESRWPPGSRTAYNNTGYLVLAAIIEKITKTPFEEYVKQHIFTPLNMSSSDYFYTDFYAQNAVTHYKGETPVTYAHINNRASGALNSHVDDLLKLVTMMMSQQDDDVLTLTSKMSMMSPSFSRYSAEGIKIGWGFGVTQVTRGNIVWFAQEGSVPGASAFVGWHTKMQLGIVILANNNSPAIQMILNKVGQLVTSFDKPGPDKSTTDKPKTSANAFDEQHITLTGNYKLLNPVSSNAGIVSAMPWKLVVKDKQAMIKPLFGPSRHLLAGSNGSFLHPQTGQKVLASGDDPLEGEVIYYGPLTLIKVSAIQSLLPLLSILLFTLTMLLTFLLALIWIPIWMFKRNTNVKLNNIQLSHRLAPAINAALMILTTLLIKSGFGSATPFTLFGQITLYSVALFLFSVLIPTLITGHLLLILKQRKSIPATNTTNTVANFMGRTISFTAYLHVIFGIPFIIVMLSFGYVGFISWQ